MLRINKLSKTYTNGIHALRDVSFDISEGIFGLLGPNGAGKSTLMRTLATLQSADLGDVMLDDVDVLAAPVEIRKRLGYLPQEFGVYPQVSAEEFLDQLALFKGFTSRMARREVVQQQLQLVNLYAERHQKLGTFSGGMRQRFGIAQALLGSPRLLIVDEPTAGLDPAERIRFQNLLSEIGKDRILLLSTHIVEDLVDLCHEMAIMDEGCIVKLGTPEALIDELDDQVWMGDSREIDKESQQVLCSKLLKGKKQTRVLSRECPGPEFKRVEPTLNDVYFAALLAPKELAAPR